MARAGSTSTRRRSTKADEQVTPETTVAETETTPTEDQATEEAHTVSTTTIDEATAAEPEASVNTESNETKSENKTAEIDLTAFNAALDEVLTGEDGFDPETGTVPEVGIEKVKSAYRDLSGAKAKNAAKERITELLRDAITEKDMVKGYAVMTLGDAVKNAGSGGKGSGGDRKPADPKLAFVERLAALHLAYALVREDVPEGVERDEVYGLVDTKVEELSDAADALFTWVKADPESRGDEPEADAIVKAAVKLAQGKAAKAKSTVSRTSSDKPRRDVRKHINQVFADKAAGTVLKVAEIAKAKTDEYPDGDCSPGAVTAALKSERGVEGFKFVGEPVGSAQKL